MIFNQNGKYFSIIKMNNLLLSYVQAKKNSLKRRKEQHKFLVQKEKEEDEKRKKKMELKKEKRKRKREVYYQFENYLFKS